MVDRQFSEVDLRRMLEYATGLREDVVKGRWIAEAVHVKHLWEIILEPDLDSKLMVVVTAYPIG